MCAHVTVTNCNLGAAMMGGSVPNGTNTETYSYCNMLGLTQNGLTNGGHNIAYPGDTPGYANLDTDWRYSNTALKTADSAGGPIGSLLHWLVAVALTPTPAVTSVRFWLDY